jgi:hypothetical protein
MHCMNLTQIQVAGFCEHGKELKDSLMGREFRN